ncbi:hypothetical protein MTO96_040836 [Rhipicephalus appendiculatus]
MTDVDIRHLCTIYDDLPLEEMEAVDTCMLLVVNPFNLAPHDDPIYRSIKAIRGNHERLLCMAQVYSWILPRSPQTTWALYSVDGISSVFDATQIGLELARKVRSADNSAAESVSDVGNAWCLTIMTTQGSHLPSTHVPISINVWIGLPFVAIHMPDITGPDATNWPLLASIVSDLGKCFYGFYSSLASARSAAASYLPDESE